MSGKSIYISGYARTGKDTLYARLCGNVVLPQPWLVFSTPKWWAENGDWILDPENPQRFAFADELKRMVAERTQVPWNEAEKDTLTVEGLTLREWCFRVSAEKKRTHGEKVFANIVHGKASLHEGTSIVTDLRFLCELPDNPDAALLRLYRSDVPVGKCQEMDTVRCHAVLCTKEEDFEKLKTLQPQYKDYVLVGKIE